MVNSQYINENLQPERLKVPNNAHLIDNKIPATPENLRQLFPDNPRIFVLDFAVLFKAEDIASGKVQQIQGPDGTILGLIDNSALPVIINIDHHSLHKSFAQNISTTHQILVYQREYNDLNLQNSPVVVNHTDTDSILAVLSLENPGMPAILKIAFSHAAVAADHSGEFDPLIILIDTIYKARNLNLSLQTVIEFLKAGGIQNLPQEIQTAYENELKIREMSEVIVINKEFKDLGAGVILIERQDGERFQTIPFPLLFQKHGIFCTVVIIASPHAGGKYKFNVRCGLDFPVNTNLQILSEAQGLNKYGYGGRAHAGGNDRQLDRPETMAIKPEEFGGLIAQYWEALEN